MLLFVSLGCSFDCLSGHWNVSVSLILPSCHWITASWYLTNRLLCIDWIAWLLSLYSRSISPCHQNTCWFVWDVEAVLCDLFQLEACVCLHIPRILVFQLLRCSRSTAASLWQLTSWRRVGSNECSVVDFSLVYTLKCLHWALGSNSDLLCWSAQARFSSGFISSRFVSVRFKEPKIKHFTVIYSGDLLAHPCITARVIIVRCGYLRLVLGLWTEARGSATFRRLFFMT
jgi:hypothetical protein